MNDITVPSPGDHTTAVLQQLTDALPGLTPELRKAASWVLENPGEIGVTPVRAIAKAAGVKPNTLVRMARAIGFDGFDALRQPFRDEIRAGQGSFPDRARWLQALARGGRTETLMADLAEAAIDGIEQLYRSTDPAALKAAADAIVAARRTYVLGVGVANPPARNFAYVAGMAMDCVSAIPQAGSLPADDLARAGRGDVLIAMTFRPFRREVIEAVATARTQEMQIIAISDTPAAPIMSGAAHRFTVPTEAPQTFTSTVALTAFLETLIAMVVADADDKVIANLEAFHDRRHRLGIYSEDAE